ncbi:Actin-related protein 10 [Escovopsis weberi]|uniref:Actin-related protein 10 n=1 Tax=Escovopsis weberi TaxID=150374 RepID=A0A0M8N1W6_ESCWE|nr:Actin-related protein 10 [Escovopsis weberi]
MASSAGPAPAHRSVTSIRGSQHPGSSTPNTPPRNPPAAYGSSPSTIRADDDFLIVEVGARFMRVGFAGDNQPKVALTFGPGGERRAGDFTEWQAPRGAPDCEAWADEHEIWHAGARGAELGLIYDRLDRLIRDAFMRCLLIDSRPRRVGLVLDSAVPIPLLSTMLDLLFKGFQAPMISLMSAATMTTVSAGVRSALVIDMGWRETVVTSVYEYREVKCTRTVRAGKFLHGELYHALRKIITGRDGPKPENDDDNNNSGGNKRETPGENDTKGDDVDPAEKRVVSFAECEDVMHRLMWCRPSTFKSALRQSAQLDTVVEQDESDADAGRAKPVTRVPLRSTSPPRTIEVPLEDMADVCDDTFFDKSVAPRTFDDHEMPLHLLVYQHLVQLPIDIRAVCMPRLIFTGGCANIPGIRERIVDEVTSMVGRRGWANVSGKGVEDARNSHFSDRRASIPGLARLAGVSQAIPPAAAAAAASEPSASSSSSSGISDDLDLAAARPSPVSVSAQVVDPDPIEAKVARHRPKPPLVQGFFRTIHSLGPWAGASLLCQLKVPAMATVDRELWLQQGAGGATRPSEVDAKAQQRQSMGTGGVIRVSGGHHTNWTLGTWGYL